jgi:cell division protease FtsH
MKKKEPEQKKKKGKSIFLEIKDRAKSKDKKTKSFTFIYFVLGFVAIAIINTYYFTSEIKSMPYSEFKDLISKGKITDLVIDAEVIQGSVTLDNGKKSKFMTSRVEDPDLVKDMQKNSIKFEGHYENKFVKAIISWVLPLAVIFLI